MLRSRPHVEDTEEAAKGYAAHSDQERVLEDSIYKHVQFIWNAVTTIPARVQLNSSLGVVDRQYSGL